MKFSLSRKHRQLGQKLGVYSWREGGREGGREREREREREGHIDKELQHFLTVSARCLARVHKVRENASSSSSLLSCLERGSHDVR